MRRPENSHRLSVGVNLAGYLDSVLGVGEAARQVRHALEAAGVPVAPYTLVADSAEHLEGGPPEWSGPPRHPVNLVCVNADGMEGAHDALGPDFFRGRYTIGLWWWEVDAFPERWARAFDPLDEVWVGSHHVADALAAVSPVPVVRVPLPVRAAPARAARDGGFDLPGGFRFLYAFDYSGGFERKNPLGALRAFERAFPPGQGPVLVLKCLGAERYRDDHARLVEAAAGRPDVHLIDRRLDEGQMAELMEACDCYVSLHRSEGFGLTIAEAMLRGKPVIATDYSGSRDYVTGANAFPVDYRLVPIGPGNDPYPAEGTWAEPDVDHAARQMERVAGDPNEARRRGERARGDMQRGHSPEAAGAEMARRLARVAGLPAGRDGSLPRLDTEEALRRVRGAPPAMARDARLRGLRGPLRAALLRLVRPQAVHQRLVDEELLRLLRTLDERLTGLAASQASLAAEVSELRERVDAQQPPEAGS